MHPERVVIHHTGNGYVVMLESSNRSVKPVYWLGPERLCPAVPVWTSVITAAACFATMDDALEAFAPMAVAYPLASAQPALFDSLTANLALCREIGHG